MKQDIHDLLRNLVEDSELPPSPEVAVSDASRRKVDAIVEKMNQEQQDARTMPKPVYDRPPSRKRPPVAAPDPVSHFSEEPSQNPVVRMHDRLLQDALPQPDADRKPTQKSGKKNEKSRQKKQKKNSAESAPKKNFHIEIKDELPPDIPRDTTVADRLKQEKLQAVLAATPPRTPEQLRQEKVKKRAAQIKKQMQLHKEAPQLPASEPEEPIPAWEEKLSEFSEIAETENSEQLRFLKETESPGIPALSEIPEIPEISGEDAGLEQFSESLGEVETDSPEIQNAESRPAGKPKKKSGKNKKKKKQKKSAGKGLIGRISSFWEKVFTKDTSGLKEQQEAPDSIPAASGPDSEEQVFYHPPEKITEVQMHSGPEPQNLQKPNLDFTPTASFETVTMPAVKPKTKKKVSVSKRKKTIS